MTNDALRLRGPCHRQCRAGLRGLAGWFGFFIGGEFATVKGKDSRAHKRKRTRGTWKAARRRCGGHAGSRAPPPPPTIPRPTPTLRHSRVLCQGLPESPPLGCSRLPAPLPVGGGGTVGGLCLGRSVPGGKHGARGSARSGPLPAPPPPALSWSPAWGRPPPALGSPALSPRGLRPRAAPNFPRASVRAFPLLGPLSGSCSRRSPPSPSGGWSCLHGGRVLPWLWLAQHRLRKDHPHPLTQPQALGGPPGSPPCSWVYVSAPLLESLWPLLVAGHPWEPRRRTSQVRLTGWESQ